MEVLRLMKGAFGMAELIMCIIAILYVAWAIYAGNRVLTGKSQWLDGEGAANKTCKFILAFIIGMFIGAFYIWIFMWNLIIESNR